MKERYIIAVMGFFVFGVFLFSVIFGTNIFSITGYAVYSDSAQADFDNGTYDDTAWNGSSVIISFNNDSGNFTSRIFDAGFNSTWNNITVNSTNSIVSYIYGVDGGGEVYSSTDSGNTWVMTEENYGRSSDTSEMIADSSYLYIFAESNREVWRSSDYGVTFSVVNDSFANSGILVAGKDSNERLIIADASGDIYESTDNGLTWNILGDFNGGSTNNAKGLGVSSVDEIFVVDGSGSVYNSTDGGTVWNQVSSGYGGGSGTDDLEVDLSGDLFILNNKQIYRSTDNGVNWAIINNSFTSYSQSGTELLIDSNDDFYIADVSGRVFQSTDNGFIWNELGDLNGGASNDPKGLVEFNRATNIIFEVRSCDDASCSGESFSSANNLSNLGVIDNQYFQYRVSFSTPLAGSSSSLMEVFVDYTLLNSAPTLILNEPQDILYLSNESIPLNYSVNDIDSNLDSCWYNIDLGSNISLPFCSNITFSVPTDGVYVFTLYANDSYGLESFAQTLFDVDSTGVFVSLTEPNGTKTTRLALPLEYIVTGNNLTCIYNVKTSIGGDIILNTSLANCIASTFDVSTDGDFVLNIYVNNTFGSFASDSSSFTVDTTGCGGDTGGGDFSAWGWCWGGGFLRGGGGFGGGVGSGGGGGVIGGGGLILTSASFKIEPVSAIVFIGEEKSLKVVVQNNGRITANKCFLFAKAGYEDYIESELISNIGVGEIVEFPFVLNVLDKDVLLLDLKLNCLDFIGVNVTMDIILLEYELGVEFDSISFVSDDELLVSYSINPNVDFSDTLFFKIVDAYEEVISIKIIDHNLVRDGLFTGKVLFDIGAAEEGLLKIRVFDSNEFLLIEEAIIYGGSAITGFVSLGILDGNDILIGGIVLIFLVISSFVIFRIIKLKRGESPRLRDARVVKIIKASSIGQALAFTNKRNMAVDPKGRKRGV